MWTRARILHTFLGRLQSYHSKIERSEQKSANIRMASKEKWASSRVSSQSNVSFIRKNRETSANSPERSTRRRGMRKQMFRMLARNFRFKGRLSGRLYSTCSMRFPEKYDIRKSLPPVIWKVDDNRQNATEQETRKWIKLRALYLLAHCVYSIPDNLPGSQQ